MKKFTTVASAIAGAFWLVSSSALAVATPSKFDGSRPVLCASVDTVECDPTGECMQGTALSVNVPQFFRINFEDRSIQGTRPDGTDVTTKIMSRTADTGQLILQGVENGRGWSMAIEAETGRMTLTASAREAGFMVFGACTILEK